MAIAAAILAGAIRPAASQSAGAQAEVLFRQGRKLLDEGKLAEACGAFEESQKLDPLVTTLLNLANCREKQGMIATAWGLFLEVERQTRASTTDADKQLHETAMRFSAKLEGRVSKLTIAVPAESLVDGLEVLRDGASVAPIMWNRALPIDGGAYKVTARAPGATAWTGEVTIGAEGDSKTIEVPNLRQLAAASTVSTPPPVAVEKHVEAPRHESVPTTHAPIAAPTVTATPTPITAMVAADEKDTTPSRIPLVLGGTSVILAGVSLGFMFWGDSTYDDAKHEIIDQERRDSLYDSANHKRYAAQGFAVASVVTAGVALWMYLKDRRGGEKGASRGIAASATGLALVGTF
jgi:hypothetical protein